MLSRLKELGREFSRPHTDLAEALKGFDAKGYAILRGVVPHRLCDQFWRETEQVLATEPELRIVSRGAPQPNKDRARPFGSLYDGIGNPDRIIDIEAYSKLAPKLLLHHHITDFLGGILGERPTCIQTLTYSHSSQQDAHSDKHLVSPRASGAYRRDTLTAAWIALEEASDENGALVVWPGSHQLKKPQLKADLCGNYAEYTKALRSLCADAGIEPIRFFAEKGDVLFWHGDLIHGGGPIREKGKTRKSLVCHYAALGDEPVSAWDMKTAIPFKDGHYFGPSDQSAV